MMRIGLFSTTLAQRVQSTSVVDIYADVDPLFSGVMAGEIVTLGFDFTTKVYKVSVAGMSKSSLKPLRIVPRTKNSVETLLDYRSTPTGSGLASDNRFRHIIEMQYSTKTCKLWLINELPLGYYLKGLGETSSASPLEFQKVMLSAARTYAMYHYNRGVDNKIKDGSTKHADEHFHLDSTYDQVYRGYGSELRLPILAEAENQTRGLIITYQGQVAITPYFSRSDGRTRDWTEVWGGTGMPWLKSVVVPADVGQTLWGHGVGMSARGALLMVVNEKKSWDTVIKYFYQGVDIQKVY
jgi:peptidoglycan hydrolase-like amidase